jgi:hypothetical protein
MQREGIDRQGHARHAGSDARVKYGARPHQGRNRRQRDTDLGGETGIDQLVSFRQPLAAVL